MNCLKFSNGDQYKFKRLKTTANIFTINLTICDLLSCCLHRLAIYSAFRGRMHKLTYFPFLIHCLGITALRLVLLTSYYFIVFVYILHTVLQPKPKRLTTDISTRQPSRE